MFNIYCKLPWANFLPYGSRSSMTTRWQLSLLRHYCILKVKGTDVNLRDDYNANCIMVLDCIFHYHSYETIPPFLFILLNNLFWHDLNYTLCSKIMIILLKTYQLIEYNSYFLTITTYIVAISSCIILIETWTAVDWVFYWQSLSCYKNRSRQV